MFKTIIRRISTNKNFGNILEIQKCDNNCWITYINRLKKQRLLSPSLKKSTEYRLYTDNLIFRTDPSEKKHTVTLLDCKTDKIMGIGQIESRLINDKLTGLTFTKPYICYYNIINWNN